MNTPIFLLSQDEGYEKMHTICAKIYGARNIWLKNDDILDALKNIDQLFRTVEYSGDMEKRMDILDSAAQEISTLHD